MEALGYDGRARVLRRMQKWLVDNADRVAQTIVDESGKSAEDALMAEVAYGAGALGFWARRAPKYLADEEDPLRRAVRARPQVARPLRTGRRRGRDRPVELPAEQQLRRRGSALAAGNAVVLKPSQVTPLTSLLLADGLRECRLPEDAIQVVIGGADSAQALIDEVDFVMFTGSTATGRR